MPFDCLPGKKWLTGQKKPDIFPGAAGPLAAPEKKHERKEKQLFSAILARSLTQRAVENEDCRARYLINNIS